MSDDELYHPDEYDDYTMKDHPPIPRQKSGSGIRTKRTAFQINRPIAGATHDKDLPVGEHRQLYSSHPNGVKVTVMLEELLALGISEASTMRGW